MAVGYLYAFKWKFTFLICKRCLIKIY
jgi:hypothetical protein